MSKRDYYLLLAEDVAERSTCLRRKYGAVIVVNDRVVATGYNGSPAGMTNCCDTGQCYRQANNIPAGEMYEVCRSIHAEQNAILQAGIDRCRGGVLYLVGKEWSTGLMTENTSPCVICRRFILQAGIKKVITNEGEIDTMIWRLRGEIN